MSTHSPDSLAFCLAHAARVLSHVLEGQSLADGLLSRVPEPARPAVQHHVYQTLRRYGRGDFFLSRLLRHALPAQQIRALLLVSLCCLEEGRESDYTVVDQAVSAAGEGKSARFKGLVNAVLRAFLRRREELQAAASQDLAVHYAYPGWWLTCLRTAFPEQWAAIAEAGNQHPPMAVRVNRRRIGREDWLSDFWARQPDAVAFGSDGVRLEYPVPVERLPGFFEGLVSVQDLGAQKAADLLAPQAGSRVLDACSAPGGKAAHLLERADLDLLALDLKPSRCRKVMDNLHRLGLKAEVKVADCRQLDTWWDGRPFDAVLADVPCTASGVVRRHPDSKWLRRPGDIASFVSTQSAILQALWQVLRPGGKLLYATCSVFPEENGVQLARFLAQTPGSICCCEEQLLPDPDHDGFYYCLLEKKA